MRQQGLDGVPITSRRQCHMDDIPDERRVVLALGAGLHSTAMLLWWLKEGRRLDAVVFANTGEEPAGVYMVAKHIEAMCHERDILYKQVRHRHKKRLADAYTEQEAIPYRTQRSCTDNFKLMPQRIYLDVLGWKKPGVVTLIGYSTDEASRVKDSDVLYSMNCYPLVDAGISTAGCKQIIADAWHGPPVGRSMCMCCPHGGPAWLQNTWRTRPEVFARYEAMEKAGRNYPKDTLLEGRTLESYRKEWERQATLPMADVDKEMAMACTGPAAGGCGT